MLSLLHSHFFSVYMHVANERIKKSLFFFSTSGSGTNNGVSVGYNKNCAWLPPVCHWPRQPDVTAGMGQKENHMDDEPKWERCTFHATERGSISSGWDGESDITSFAVILVGPEKHRFLLSEIPVKLKATCHRSYLTPSVVQLHLLLFWLYDSSHILLGVEIWAIESST